MGIQAALRDRIMMIMLHPPCLPLIIFLALILNNEAWSNPTNSGDVVANVEQVSYPDEESERRRKFNIYCSPVDLVLSRLSDIDLGVDYKIAEFITGGIGYRNKSGTGSGLVYELPLGSGLSAFRVQSELYTSGHAYKSSFVVQLKYTWYSLTRNSSVLPYSFQGPGALLGWRWFWTDPGESGLNVSLLAGGETLSVANNSKNVLLVGLVPQIRIDLGYAF